MRRRCSRSAKSSSRRRGGLRRRGGGEHRGFQSQPVGRSACARSRAAAGRIVVGRQGAMGPGAQDRDERRDGGGRVGSCLSASRRGRSRQCRILVPAGRPAGREGFAGNRMGADRFRTARRRKDMSTATHKLIKGATGDWEMVIGLEVHAQVTSKSKLFSGASTEFGGEPNTHVSLVDAAMPGMLPVINEECVRQAVRTGLGLNAQINLRSVFDRKNYFYPDSPQGYQISQYKSPIVGEGEIQVDLTPEHSIRVGIERLHLEQDAGKSLHDQSPTMSLVDLNRSGVALMEIVSKPDIRSSEQAKAYVAKLRSILRYLGTCDGDMEKGSLRADVNVSVRKPGGPLGTRCEIKNMNSINFIG